jgi:hypothetical protein
LRIERYRNFIDGNQCPHHRRPQTNKEKRAACSRNHVLWEGDWRQRFSEEGGGPEIDQSAAETEPEQQQTNTGPAIRKS